MSDLFKHELDNGETIVFSLVEKQSQKGFSMNKRVFLMLENRFICYLSSPKLDFPLTIDFVSKHTKMVVPLQQMHRLQYREDNQLQIYFWIYINGKRVEKSWTLKMATPSLLSGWQNIFDQYSNRSRKGTFENRNSKEAINNLDSHPFESIAKVSPRILKTDSKQDMEIKLSNQIINSAHLLNQDPNQSYFANLHLVTPSLDRGYQQPQSYGREIAPTLEPSKPKDHNIYFSPPNYQHWSKQNNFKNYYRPYLDDLLQLDNNSIRLSQLNEIDSKYSSFIQYAKLQVTGFIDNKLEQAISLHKLRTAQQRGNSDNSNWIRYDQMDDILIQTGLIELKQAGNNHYICDDSFTQMAMNNFKNLDYLHQVISKDPILNASFFLPMGCMVRYKGYVSFVTSKIEPTTDQDYQTNFQPENRPSVDLFDRLSQATKMDFQILEDEQCIQFLPKNRKKDKFVIIHSRKFLPELQSCLPIRKQAFSSIFPEVEKRVYIKGGGKREVQDQNYKIALHINNKIRQLSDLMNKLQIYPVSPSEISPIIHAFGLNIKFLHRICNNISQTYIQSILKTQAAIRSFTTVFSKKMQQSFTHSRGISGFQETGRELLNAFLGLGEESTQIWKVVTLHCQKYFNLSVQSDEINKGYLLLGLSHHLAIEIYPSSSNVDKIFKMPSFVQGLKFYPKVKHPNFLPSFLKDIEAQYDIPMKGRIFTKIFNALQLQQRPFPNYIKYHGHLYNKLLHLFSFYIKPKDPRVGHLKLYEWGQAPKMEDLNLYYFQRKLTEIRWLIKDNTARDHILILMNKLKETIQNYYGKFHPFISDICQLQSLYHLELGEHEQAIALNKDSLSNMVQCCGNNHRHLKLSNSYFHIGQCLSKCYRYQQALLNYKKAKNILQINNYQDLPEYAHILYKIGRLTLLDSKDNESYQTFLRAVKIYEANNLYSNWDALVELYEMIPRCLVKWTPFDKGSFQLNEIQLAEHCITQLQRILSVQLEFELCSDQQFTRLFKIIIQQYISKLKPQERPLYRDYLIEIIDSTALSPETSLQPTRREAIIFFKEQIIEGAFLSLIQNYVNSTGEILSRLKNEKRVGRLLPHLRNELIQNYDKFMRYILALTGQCFLLNIIK